MDAALFYNNSRILPPMPSNEYHIIVDQEGKTAVDLLAQHTDYSRQHLKQTMTKGAVWLTHKQHTTRLRRSKKILHKEDELHLYYDARILAVIPPEPLLIADEGAYSIWYKPYGMLSQGSKWGDHCTINRWVEQHFQPQRPAIIVHRLDRAATGLMIIAHQKQIAGTFTQLFQKRAITKQYQAIVQGEFTSNKPPQRIEKTIDERTAVSYVSGLIYNKDKDYSLLKIEIETGRKHQIRRHLASIGFPIVGDRLYGDAQEVTKNLQLTAYFLEFECPVTGQKKQFEIKKEQRLEL